MLDHDQIGEVFNALINESNDFHWYIEDFLFFVFSVVMSVVIDRGHWIRSYWMRTTFSLQFFSIFYTVFRSIRLNPYYLVILRFLSWRQGRLRLAFNMPQPVLKKPKYLFFKSDQYTSFARSRTAVQIKREGFEVMR